jgi:NDP-sugar pyrophosphorylase family protein
MYYEVDDMQAVILAGGKGTRLQPYTTVLPKPLMPVGDYPILEIVIRQLKRYGFKQIILSVGYHYELFKAYFRDGKKWGVQIKYSLEDKPLGTAGPLRLIKDLNDNFLVMNGDTLTDLDYRELYSTHVNEKNIMTVATKCRSVKIDFGVIRYGSDAKLISYTEKPELEYTVGIGVNILSKGVLDFIPEGERFDMPDLVHTMIQREIPIRCYPFKGYWLDIGRHEDYRNATDQFRENEIRFLGEDNAL